MSIAKKCDRCGNLYEAYNTKKDRENTNGIATLIIDTNQRYVSRDVIDFCPRCNKEFFDWLEKERVKND